MTYEEELTNNNAEAQQLLAILFPQLKLSVDKTFALLESIEASGMDFGNVPPVLVSQVLRGVVNIMNGTGHGQVIVHVDPKTCSVQTRENQYPIDLTTSP